MAKAQRSKPVATTHKQKRVAINNLNADFDLIQQTRMLKEKPKPVKTSNPIPPKLKPVDPEEVNASIDKLAQLLSK